MNIAFFLSYLSLLHKIKSTLHKSASALYLYNKSFDDIESRLYIDTIPLLPLTDNHFKNNIT